MNDSKVVCPYCEAKLNNERVPSNMKKLYGLKYWDRRIGIFNVEQRKNEGWICPYCFKSWKAKD